MTERKRILIVLGFLNPEILAGFTRYAKEANWILNPFSVLHATVPKGWRADGLLTTNVFRPDLHRFVTQTARQIPTVLHGCNDFGFAIPNVECDEQAAGRLAADHLISQCHNHFAYFQYSQGRHASRRREGFQARLAAAGRTCISIEKVSQDGVGSAEYFSRCLDRLPKPLGLFAEDDLLAARSIEAAIEKGWRVPEDLSVVGCGNMKLLCEQGSVPITSIAIPLEDQAYKAASLLDSMLSGRRADKWPVTFQPAGLIARQSTDSVAARIPVVQRALSLMAARLGETTLNVEAVARGSGVSVRLLYNQFQADLGRTPMAELLRMRLRKAKDMLQNGSDKIGAISENCGFANMRSFQRAFLRNERQPPAKWRAAHQAAAAGNK